MLESLHYYTTKDGKKILPIHKAVESKNNKMVNLLLQFMSKIDYCALNKMGDIAKDLIGYKNFT